MHYKGLFTALAATLALVACVPDETVPAGVTSTVNFATKTLDIAKTGETKTAAISATGDWTLTCDADWIKISPMSGTSATRDVTVTVETANEAEEARSAQVIITDVLYPVNRDTMIVVQKSNAGFNGVIRDADTFKEFIELASELSDSENITMSADIDLGGETIKPITSFAASLDGCGHSISNFKIASEQGLAGLILTNNGTIKNLVAGSADGKAWDKTTTIKFASSDITGSAAGLVAVNNGLMENVTNFASIDFNAAAATDAAVGGIAGNFGGPEAHLVGCVNYGTINFSGIAAGRAHMGGVLGVNIAQAGAVVEDCENKGNVVKATINQKEFTMGGVVGRTQVTTIIRNCVNSGAVSYEATETPGSYIHIGGVLGAGYFGNQVDGCTNKGEISSVINQVNRMGGIVGTINTGGVITGCQNEGKVGINNPGNANWQAVGGIMGFEEKAASADQSLEISGCTNKGEVYAITNNSTTHANKIGVGGIAGIICSNYLTISGNTNTGKVWGTNEGGVDLYAGGIVGWYLKGAGYQSSSNKNSGSVTVTATTGAAGGIIGNASIAGIKLVDEENTGTITCSTASAAGAIAGLNAGSIKTSSINGTVNGTAVTAGNFAGLIQGSGSKGSASGCYFGGSGPVDYVSVNPAQLSFKSAGEELTVSVSSNCKWTVSASESWLSLSAASGDESTTSITVTASENTATNPRTATITFKSQSDATKTATVSVTQAERVSGLGDKKIKTADDLKAFIELAGDVAGGDTYTLEADINCGGAALKPIATWAGELDGKGHKITGFTITSTSDLAGFILTNEGTVKNLVIGSASTTETITFEDGTTSAAAAAVIAVNKGTVEGVTNYADIVFNASTGAADASAAGVVGQVNGEEAVVKSCKNYGKVTMSGTMSNRAALGGVVGTSLTGGATIDDCHNYAEVIYSKKNEKELAMAGVFARANAITKVSNCTNNGAVSYTYSEGAPGSYQHIGGVVGAAYYDTEISYCTNKAKVSSCIQQTLRMGGVVATMNAGGKVLNCTNDGEVEFKQPTLASKIWFGIAGVVGFEEKCDASTHPLEISNCTNNAKVTVEMAHTNNGHANRIGVGGILGNSSTVSTMAGNANKGAISVKNAGGTDTYVGGICGFMKVATNLTTSANVNSAAVTVEAASGAVGGVFGNLATASVEIKGDTNKGAVSYGSDNAKTGSIAGLCAGTLVQSKVGGSVNGTALTADNFGSYIMGTASTGSQSGCAFQN